MISLKNVSKNYKQAIAIDKLNISIDQSHATGIVGPTGSGKSTTLKVLSGLIFPDTGEIEMPAGINVGYLGEKIDVGYGIKGGVLIKMIAALTGEASYNSVNELIDILKMQEALKVNIRSYSTGMSKKLGIILAFINSPSLVVLDEPFENIDPVDRYKLVNYIDQYVKKGRSVIISSHILYEMEECCSTIYFIHNGRVIIKYQRDIDNPITIIDKENEIKLITMINLSQKPDLNTLYRRIYS